MKILTVLLSCFLFFIHSPFSVAWGMFGEPEDYDECILEGMKGTVSDIAARAINISCREKFPKREKVYNELPEDMLNKISSRGVISSQRGVTKFYAKIHNGSEWEVRRLLITIRDSATEEEMEYAHIFTYGLSPGEMKNIKCDVFTNPENFTFWITRATGEPRS